MYTIHKFSDEVEREIVDRYLAGESTFALGEKYGVSRNMIRRILIRWRVERRKAGDFPLRSNAKLYGSDPGVLRKMVAEGMSIQKIGRVLGMSSSNIHNACGHFGIALRKQGRERREIPDTLFASPLTADESWLLRFLLTDGCVNGKEFIKLSITDEDGAKLAAKIIGFGNIRKSAPQTSEYNGQIIQGRLPVWNYTACSMDLVERLANYGLAPRKTKTLTFPSMQDIILPDFIRGVWDGDGGWYIAGNQNSLHASFGCASERFVRALYNSLASVVMGSKVMVRCEKSGNFWRLTYSGTFAVKLAKWMYYHENVAALERKKAVVQPFL